jgi:hypothetical protein
MTIGQLYFWSFELVVFMVLLNFLLAIIVDSFCEVKEATIDATSIYDDIADLIRIRWADTAAALFRGGAASASDGLGRKSHVGIVDLGAWLKKMAFSNGQTEHRSDPSLLLGSDSRVVQLGQVKLTKEDLKEVLREQHAAMHAAGELEARQVHSNAFLRICFGVEQPVDLGNAAELDRMAYWIFERFAEEDRGHGGADTVNDEHGLAAGSPLMDVTSEV